MPAKRRNRQVSTTNASSKPSINSITTTTTATTSRSGDFPEALCSSSTNNHSPDSGHTNNFILSNFNSGGDDLTEKQLRKAYFATLTKEQLKTECRKRGQKTTGNRIELLQRLGVKMSQMQKTESSLLYSSPKNAAAEKTKQQQQSTKIESTNGVSSLPRKQSMTKNKEREREREEREKLVLWRRPLQTIKYCALECITLAHIYGKKLAENWNLIIAMTVLTSALGIFYKVPGRHQLFIDMLRTNIWFMIYWIGLGVLSSVGLGTGLHTFLLYLGPHIASVTLAAYECNTLNFPQPPYPDEIICPNGEGGGQFPPNLWNIMAKVRFEAFLWGAGTALGELPPYFMAKAARLSGYDDSDDDDDLQKFNELNLKKNDGNLNVLDRAKLFMEKVVEKVGFFGILVCASIPNPLFDLAGITCGHFLVPFWTFFGATLIGKAIIKMHIQKIFVIIAFNESLIERAVDVLGFIPVFGHQLQTPFKSFLQNQKTRLHRQKNTPQSESGNMLAKFFEKIVILMIGYFIISIVNSLAQNYHKRIHKIDKNVKKLAKD